MFSFNKQKGHKLKKTFFVVDTQLSAETCYFVLTSHSKPFHVFILNKEQTHFIVHDELLENVCSFRILPEIFTSKEDAIRAINAYNDKVKTGVLFKPYVISLNNINDNTLSNAFFKKLNSESIEELYEYYYPEVSLKPILVPEKKRSCTIM